MKSVFQIRESDTKRTPRLYQSYAEYLLQQIRSDGSSCLGFINNFQNSRPLFSAPQFSRACELFIKWEVWCFCSFWKCENLLKMNLLVVHANGKEKKWRSLVKLFAKCYVRSHFGDWLTHLWTFKRIIRRFYKHYQTKLQEVRQ